MSNIAISAAIALAGVLSSAACDAAPVSTGDARLDEARTTVRSDFANERDVSFRGEKVVEITGQEGSTVTVVCGEVKRRGWDTSIGEGWRYYYYVVSYNPVPMDGPPNLPAMWNNEPGAFDEIKITVPPIYAAGDYEVLFGADGTGTESEKFRRGWMKFCQRGSRLISEQELQLR